MAKIDKDFKIIPVKEIYSFLHNIRGCYDIKPGQIEVVEKNLKDIDCNILNVLWNIILSEYTDSYSITWGKIKTIAEQNGIQIKNEQKYTFVTVCPGCTRQFSVDDVKCPFCNHNRNEYAKTCHECDYIYQDKIGDKWDVKRICPECAKDPNSKIVHRRTAYLIRSKS